MRDKQRIQITVASWDGNSISGTDDSGHTVTTLLPEAHCYHTLPTLLNKGCRLNLLSCRRKEDGTLLPRDIIYHPDCLIDISALARCLQPYGSHPAGYILNLLESTDESSARLLGEAANIFLDDCVNSRPGTPASYRRSMETFFREYPLQLSVCPDIDKKFFDDAFAQFNNIQQKMGTQALESSDGYRQEGTQIEPSFFCEPLGLQGRIDLLQGNSTMLIELKSGKADEYRGGPKEEHRLQMSLYREMLSYSLGTPRSNIRAMLFYSRYPRFFVEQSNATQISIALMLRNHIVSLLEEMCTDGLYNRLKNLSPDDLNTRGDHGRLWSNYIRPRIEKILSPIHEADELLCRYIFGNIAFVAREMMIAKVGGHGTNIQTKKTQSRSCFADVWRAPLSQKIEEGNILTGLSILSLERADESDSITDITFAIETSSDHFYPNFRAGDTVFVYRLASEADTATNQQVTRGTLTAISPTRLTLHLRHKQQGHTLYSEGSHYAIEHDHLDSTFRASLRDLYSLLGAPKERTDLLLARRQPRFDTSRTLTRSYGSEYLDQIVLKAKQADDLFMLVGPPGTGKTSQALSSIVREFYSDPTQNILLASYTNRAVDEICQALEQLPEAPQYIRIGSEQSCQPQYSPRLLKNSILQCKNREQIRLTMQQTRIFVGTIASLTARKELFKLKKFQRAIIDEATQILESQLSGLLAAVSPEGSPAIERFILIGDPKQLPAVVAQSPEESRVKSPTLQTIGIKDYGTSLFERLFSYYHDKGIEGLSHTLNRQGRMHPTVSTFANRHFYNNTLHPIPLPHQTEAATFDTYNAENTIQTILATRRAAFVATEPQPQAEESEKVNRSEALAIAQFVKEYYSLIKSNDKVWNPAQQIGIIVPFRNQIAMVAHAIAALSLPRSEQIIIDTVERYQGSQREMILFGTTITHPRQIETISSPIIAPDGTLIDRKLNVALTRARRQMYIFGNSEALSASPLYRALMDELK
ncbi:MAG: ATP-dependent helicase [Bacteroidaceae bacterium]|nr:ATP-dependent helicase [Bacteroidaceae bacterium]